LESTHKRYIIRLSYDGTNFSGWQAQENNDTVQQTIEEALSMICRSPQSILGCGRTDTGVHADDYVAHWDYDGAFDQTLWALKLNSILPKTIAIKKIEEASPSFHARFDAVSRKYHYFVHTQKNPFLRLHSCEVFFQKIDMQKMQEVAQLFLDYDHFFPVIKVNRDRPSTKCKLLTSEWVQLSDTQYRYEVSANRFLHNMVRRMVGTMLQVGKGQMDLAEVKRAMDTQTHMKYIHLAPANGLHLVEVKY